MPAALDFQQVTKEYRGLWKRTPFRALNDFSLSVDPGEIFGFLGPNGAGKTTAIHIALGLMKPTSGSGSMLGHRFGDARTRRRIGFLAENVAFYHRPAEKLVRFYGELNGIADPELAQRTKDLLQALNLYDVRSRPVAKFSRGMLQRVGLAQALINDPDLLILDEPTSALDPAARVAVRELLLTAKRNGKTVFLSSHLLSEIELICDRIAILNRGTVIRVGTVPELLDSHDQFEITARNVHSADLVGLHNNDGSLRIKVPMSEQRATLEKIWSSGGEGLRVMPMRRSLEEIFLSLTGGNGEKGNSR